MSYDVVKRLRMSQNVFFCLIIYNHLNNSLLSGFLFRQLLNATDKMAKIDFIVNNPVEKGNERHGLSLNLTNRS